MRSLREEAKALGYKPHFSIFDSTDCYGIVSDLAGGVDKATIRIQLQNVISNWKNALVTPDMAVKLAQDDTEALAGAYRDYAATRRPTRRSISTT